MRRRTFLATVASGLLAAALAVEAQRTGTIPRIGFLQGTQNENVVAFIQALRDAGYVDGRTAIVEARIYGAMMERLPAMADELVARKCDVILAAGPYAIRAALRATSTIPIVGIDLESDPVVSGWAGSLGHPGGNLTGLFLDAPELGGKEIQLLKEALPIPGISRVGINGIIVLSSPLILRERAQITGAALKNRLPTISLFTLFVEAGGLMAYGPDLPEMYKRSVTYIDRILKGAKAADLAIERPSRFRLVINVKTAKALSLMIPPSLLQRADQVIE